MEEWLIAYGSPCLLAAGFLYGINFPCPLGVLLMAAGGLARQGLISWPALLLACPLGILLGEQPWFFLGRRLRSKAPPRLAQIFRERGPSLLLTGRFIPGVPATVVPLAGMTGVSWKRFFAWDLASALLYTVTYSVCGNLLSHWLSLGQIVALAIGILVTIQFLAYKKRNSL
ncbi:VTT domain-containing protein [bacterium]|nr:VTT domain-containing protein [bacterium]